MSPYPFSVLSCILFSLCLFNLAPIVNCAADKFHYLQFSLEQKLLSYLLYSREISNVSCRPPTTSLRLNNKWHLTAGTGHNLNGSRAKLPLKRLDEFNLTVGLISTSKYNPHSHRQLVPNPINCRRTVQTKVVSCRAVPHTTALPIDHPRRPHHPPAPQANTEFNKCRFRSTDGAASTAAVRALFQIGDNCKEFYSHHRSFFSTGQRNFTRYVTSSRREAAQFRKRAPPANPPLFTSLTLSFRSGNCSFSERFSFIVQWILCSRSPDIAPSPVAPFIRNFTWLRSPASWSSGMSVCNARCWTKGKNWNWERKRYRGDGGGWVTTNYHY